VRAAGVIFFAYIGFDAVSTAAQEAKRPQRDMPIGILASLAVCTVLYIVVSLVSPGSSSTPSWACPTPSPRPLTRSGQGVAWLRAHHQDRRHRRPLLRHPRHDARPAADLLRHVQGRPAPARLQPRAPALPHPLAGHHPHRTLAMVMAGLFPSDCWVSSFRLAPLLAFAIGLRRRVRPAVYRSPDPTPLPRARLLAHLSPRRFFCGYLMYGLPRDTWARLLVWMALGLAIYFATAATIRAWRGRSPPRDPERWSQPCPPTGTRPGQDRRDRHAIARSDSRTVSRLEPGAAAEDFVGVAAAAGPESEWLRRPNRWLRGLNVALILLFLLVLGSILINLTALAQVDGISDFLQALDAGLNSLNPPRRRHPVPVHPRSPAQAPGAPSNASTELRSLAHIVDMHQLTKDPGAGCRRGLPTCPARPSVR